MERIKVVVRYLGGEVLKGFTQDFFPNKDRFHLFLAETSPAGGSVEVEVKDLKAVFLVRDFLGDPQYQECKKFAKGETPSGRKVEVTFLDGEVMVGSTLGYDRNRKGFFIFPADPRSNNVRVFVVNTSIGSIRQL